MNKSRKPHPKMFLGNRLSQTVQDAVMEMHDDAVLIALSVLTKVTRDDTLFQHYVDAVLKSRDLPNGATTDDLREMMEHEIETLHMLYHDLIHEKKGEECESPESIWESTSQTRDF